MEKYSNSYSGDYENSDEGEEYIPEIPISTFESLELAEDIIDRLQLYIHFNGLNMLTSGDRVHALVDLIDRYEN